MMHALLLYGFAALGLVALLASVLATIAVYPTLPARVPYAFDTAGFPVAYGPRPAALLFVGAQVFAFALEAIAVTHARSGSEGQPWVAAIALSSTIAVFTVMQRQTLAVAVGRKKSIGNALNFGGSFAGIVMLALVAGFLSP